MRVWCPLNCALVRPILEYDVNVWNPVTASDSSQIERVQRRFQHFASDLLSIPCMPHDYNPVSNLLDLSFLVECRYSVGLAYPKRLLYNKVDFSILVSFK